MQFTTEYRELQQYNIHPVDADVLSTTSRPIVTTQDWFSMDDFSRLELFGFDDGGNHPAWRQDHGSDTLAPQIAQERSSISSWESIQDQERDPYEPKVIDFAYLHRPHPSCFNLQIPDSWKLPEDHDRPRRTASFTAAVKSLYRDASESSLLSLYDQQTSLSAVSRREQGKAATPTSSSVQSKKTRRKSVVYRDEEVLQTTMSGPMASQGPHCAASHGALRALPTNVATSKTGLRERTMRRVRSIKQKVHLTVEVWRGEILDL